MSLPHTDAALVILCKRPRIGEGKQRLAESVGKETAYKIASDLFECALEDATMWTGPVIFSPSRQEDIQWVYQQAERAGLSFAQVLPQQDGNLGERINLLDQTIRNLGQPETVYIGTDSPMLSSQHYRDVIEAINNTDVVLSKAEDGGVVMMANTQPWPMIDNLAWSQSTLGDELAQCCEEHGLEVNYIHPGYDIDFENDLIKFCKENVQDPRPARKKLIETVKNFNNNV